MKNIMRLAIVLSVAGGVFVAGVAVGQAPATPKGVTYVARDEVKMVDVGGPKVGNLKGDFAKGAFTGLLQIPAGFTSPLHTHDTAYEAVQIEGTSSHWMKGEDGSKAKKMTPGSYWAMPGKLEHVSSCAPGKDCTILLISKGKFTFTDKTPKDAKPAGAGSAAGSAAKPAGAGSGSAAKPAGAGSAAPKK